MPFVLIALTFIPYLEKVSIRIDGVLNEIEWDSALKIDRFFQFSPVYKGSPSNNYEVCIFASPEGIYIGFIADVPKKKQNAFSLRRDGFSLTDLSEIEDGFILFISPLKGGSFYCFGLNLLGVKTDGTGNINGELDYDWDGYWEGAVKRFEDKWCVEFKIPWESINLKPRPGLNLRMNFIASSFVNREIDIVYDSGNLTDLSSCDTFCVKINKKVKKEDFKMTISPYVSLRRDTISNVDGGGDLSVAIFNNIQLYGTFHPDYCEVEPDVDIIPLSKGVEAFYPEKRKFFLEGKHLFSWNIFYTRRITKIDYGIKAYGKFSTSEYNLFYVKGQSDSQTENWQGFAYVTKTGLMDFTLNQIYKDGYGVVGLTCTYHPTKFLILDLTGLNCFSDSFTASKGRKVSFSTFYQKGSRRFNISIARNREHSEPITGFSGSLGAGEDEYSITTNISNRWKISEGFNIKLYGNASYSLWDSLVCSGYSFNAGKVVVFPPSGLFILGLWKTYNGAWDWEQSNVYGNLMFGRNRKIILNAKYGKGNGRPLYSLEGGIKFLFSSRSEIYTSGMIYHSDALGEQRFFNWVLKTRFNISDFLFMKTFFYYSTYFKKSITNVISGIEIGDFKIYGVFYQENSGYKIYESEVLTRRFFGKGVYNAGLKL